MNPFDYLNAINQTKEDLIVDEQSEKEYNAFIVNRGLSYFTDTILYANEMNMLFHLDGKLQFDYFINSIRSRKRFSKWHKKKDDDDLIAVMRCYGYSINKAKSVLSILSEDQIKIIREKINE